MKKFWWRYVPLALAAWSGQEWRAGGWWLVLSAAFWFAASAVLDRLLRAEVNAARGIR